MLSHDKYSHIGWLILLVLIGRRLVILLVSLLLYLVLWLLLLSLVVHCLNLLVLATLAGISCMRLSGSDSDNLKSVLAILTICTSSSIIPLQILHQVILDLPSKVPEAILGSTILVGTSSTLGSSIHHGTSQDCLS